MTTTGSVSSQRCDIVFYSISLCPVGQWLKTFIFCVHHQAYLHQRDAKANCSTVVLAGPCRGEQEFCTWAQFGISPVWGQQVAHVPPSSASSANSHRTKAAAQGRFCLSAASRRTNNTASHAAPHARLPSCPTSPDSAHARTEPSFLPLSPIFVCATDGSPGQTYPHPAAAPDILILRLVSAVKAPEATPLPEMESRLSPVGEGR